MYILRAPLGSPSRELLAQIKSEVRAIAGHHFLFLAVLMSSGLHYIWDVTVREDLHGYFPLKGGSAQLFAMLYVLFLVPNR